MGFVFVTGGARSGKSELAVRVGRESGRAVTVIATATAGDAEMEERIRGHRSGRPEHWSTVDAPLALLPAIAAVSTHDFLIVDCLTLWVSNLLESGQSAGDIRGLAEATADGLARRRGVVVTNEVGLGIVPANDLARTFRDVLVGVQWSFAARARVLLLLA